MSGEQKTTTSTSDGKPDGDKKASSSSPSKPKSSSRPSLFVVGSVLVVVIGVVAALATQQVDIKALFDQYFSSMKGIRVFTREELARHDSSVSKKAWLAILGDVFDVSKGETYKKGGSYAFFTGKDGSAAFVSGDFTEAGLHDDLSKIETSSLPGIKEWNTFYHTDYTFIGRLHGRFYDENGEPTDALREFEERLKVAEAQKAADKKLKQKYPNCNSSSGSGWSEVWCTEKSGGVKRDWVGVPRKIFSSDGKRTRCACIQEEEAAANMATMTIYPGCAPDSVRCNIVKAATQ